jgi:ectoine hydroxylase-related dioxygenase (phytanoyl-CoA dioxygenase family)
LCILILAAEAFREDGITRLRNVLGADLLAKCCEAFDWSYKHPGTITKKIFPGTEHEHWADNVNPSARGICRNLVTAPVFAEIVADMLDTRHVWYSAEEIFFKQGTTVGRTPWHQDTAYAPYGGKQWCNLWISFESLPRWNSLEAVRGSHHGPQYDGSAYDDPDNPAKPLHGGNWTPLPDIERERKTNPDAWPILSYPSEPGDLIIFHPHSLHGGGPLGQDCPIRHTLVLQFFGDDAVYRSLPPGSQSIWDDNTGIRDEFSGLMPGETLCCDRFFQVR